MISVKTGEYDSNGIADLGEAIEIAQRYGIANAEGAIAPEVCLGFTSLLSLVATDMAGMLPNIGNFTRDRTTVYSFNPRTRPPALTALLTDVESRVLEVASKRLPGWSPASSLLGSRMVTMRDHAHFQQHTDVYEGLVVSSQICMDGRKTMHTFINGQQIDVPVSQGDITIFACDSFGEVSRVPHGFSFVGTASAALLLGQDPTYTISGRLPMLEENPHYAADIYVLLERNRLGLL